MPKLFIGIVLIALVVTIDNALLTGLLLPSHTTQRQKVTFLTAVGILLGGSQVILAASVDKMLDNILFRLVAIILLGWMCIRTLGTIPEIRSVFRAWGTVVKLWLFTVFGNLDNMIWLGSELKGDRLWLVVSSVGTVPLFVIVGLFLSRQIEKQQWILPLGAGMMAWAAASLMLDIPVVKRFIETLDDAPRTTFQCLITIAILGIGFGVRQVISRSIKLRQ
ncbi:MAG: hypothetical protein K6T63_02410 [Alicyclobacillus herbarius]|uniref:hypothetical protein n=1 Tax=Alicyclobacillus herbarius TaxID=122960 RepID=UPI00047DA2F0|nr:hypothetical protein [Alicyclobacillus herbarius]MCL6631460.1 hypothetical protein [Alicyclobacillus herbarius]